MILWETFNKDRKCETEEDHGAEYIQEIDMWQIDKLQSPQIVEMLMEPNVFISYTGASFDSTGHIQVFIKNMKPEKWYSMTLPDGTKIATEIIADLRGTVYDNKGNK